MEKYLKDLDYDNPDLYNYMIKNNHEQTLNGLLENIVKSPKKNTTLLDSIGLLISLSSTVKFQNPENEWGCEFIFKRLVQQIDQDNLSMENVNEFIKISKLISTIKRNTLFQLSVFCTLVRMFKADFFINKYSHETFDLFVDGLKLNLKFDNNYLKACYGEKNTDQAKLVFNFRDSQNCSSLRFCIEDFFGQLDSEKKFTQFLPFIQGYFEYSIFHSKINY